MKALCETHLPDREPVARGKVRDIYDLGDKLVIVATDRISAFDWINPVGISGKGKILTQLSLFWFEKTRDLVRNHLISADLEDLPDDFRSDPEQFAGRTMLVHRCEMFPVEVVIRGYLAGSAWKEYRESGGVCGIALPPGLKESSRLERPIITPATKATDGHDINITPEQAGDIVGSDWYQAATLAAERVYLRAQEIAKGRGIILCDTKFEFGTHQSELMLADEVLTPDSSRFWPADQYEVGHGQPSYDKQYVRDWLESTGWDKNSPPPPLPDSVAARTREKYVEAYEKLTGKKVDF